MHHKNSATENSSLAAPMDENVKEILFRQLQRKGNVYANSFTEFSRQPKESSKKQLQYVLGIPIIFAIPAYYGGIQFLYPDNAFAQKPTHHNPMSSFPESHPNANLQQQSVNTQQLSSTTNDPTYDIDIRNIGEHSIPEKQQPKAIGNNDKTEKASFDPAKQDSSNDFVIYSVKDVSIRTGQISKPAGGKRIVDSRIKEKVMCGKDELLHSVSGIDDHAIHFIESGTEKGDIPSPLELTPRLKKKNKNSINPQTIRTLVG